MLGVALVAAMAVSLLPGVSRAQVPGIDWSAIPVEPISLPDDWSAAACAGDAPLLCFWEAGQAQGAVEHGAYAIESGALSTDLDNGTPVRLALAHEARRLLASVREDRELVCPTMAFQATPIVGAHVGRLPGITYGYDLWSGGRVVERVVGFMTVRVTPTGQVLDVVTAEEGNEGACQSPEGTQPFTNGGLGRVTATLTQLIARSTFGPGGGPVLAVPGDTVLAAETPAAVSVAMSALAQPEDHPGGTVLIARDDDGADALASGAAQALLDAPLLLTGPDRLDEGVAAEIGRLAATHAVVLGGESAVPGQIVTELRGLGLTVERVAGADRVSTALALADRVGPQVEQVVLARAFGTADDPTRAWADAIAAGSAGAAHGAPVLLTTTDRLDPRVAAWLRDRVEEGRLQQVLLAGGTAALSQSVRQELVEIGLGIDVAEGSDRAGTAVELARRIGLPGAAHADAVVLVDGHDWVSGVTAALLSARTHAPVLLTTAGTVPSATASFLGDAPVAIVCTPDVGAACPV